MIKMRIGICVQGAFGQPSTPLASLG